MEENKYFKKWVVFQPTGGGPLFMNMLVVGYVIKETEKQLSIVELLGSEIVRTVQKNQVIGIVKPGKIDDVRNHSRLIRNEYSVKQKQLSDRYDKLLKGNQYILHLNG